MKLVTSRNKEYEIDWIDGPTITTGQVLLQMRDDRRLPEVAAEFDGLEWMERKSDTQGDKRWEGWNVLTRIGLAADGKMILTFGQE